MSRREFIPCLNRQPKIYNLAMVGVVGGVCGFAVIGLAKGILFGLAGGRVCFAFGSWLSGMMFRGYMQRFLYWNLPFAKEWLCKNIPESSNKEEM